MENKNTRPRLSRSENTRFVRELLNSRIADCGKPLASFVIDTADLTEEVFRSRYRSGYEILHPEISELAEVAWHTALLSLAQQYTGLPFETVMLRSHIEVAGATLILNPDMRMPSDQRVPRYTNQLAQGTDVVKIAALCRVLSSILSLTEDIRVRHVTADQLYELSWLLKELKIFTGWSQKALDKWMDCADIVNSWVLQKRVQRTLPKPSLYFSLDPEIRVNNLRDLFED